MGLFAAMARHISKRLIAYSWAFNFPGSGGIALTRQIREGSVDPEQKNIYIIAIAAFAMNEDRELCFKAGMNDCLSKPVEVTLFKKCLV